MLNTAHRKTKGQADPIDVHVGKQLRVRRSLLGLSQEKLADSIGLTFQQIQKYERGINRISAGRLYKFSKILAVPVEFFYTGLDVKLPPTGHAPELNKDTLEMARYYQAIPKLKRPPVKALLKSMSDVRKLAA
jgi:transcriptional regulator with XRE-family HTH domain